MPTNTACTHTQSSNVHRNVNPTKRSIDLFELHGIRTKKVKTNGILRKEYRYTNPESLLRRDTLEYLPVCQDDKENFLFPEYDYDVKDDSGWDLKFSREHKKWYYWNTMRPGYLHTYWYRPTFDGYHYFEALEKYGTQKLREMFQDAADKRLTRKKVKRQIQPFPRGWESVMPGVYRNKYTRETVKLSSPPTEKAELTDKLKRRNKSVNHQWKKVYSDEELAREKTWKLTWITNAQYKDPISKVETLENIENKLQLGLHSYGQRNYEIDIAPNMTMRPQLVESGSENIAPVHATYNGHLRQPEHNNNLERSNNVISSPPSPTPDLEHRYNIIGVATHDKYHDVGKVHHNEQLDDDDDGMMLEDDTSISTQEDMQGFEAIPHGSSNNVNVSESFTNNNRDAMMNYAQLSQPRTVDLCDTRIEDQQANKNDDDNSICTQEDMPDVASVLPKHAYANNPLEDYDCIHDALEDIGNSLRGANDEWTGFLGHGKDHFDETDNEDDFKFITNHDWLRPGWNNGQRAICCDWELGKGCFNMDCSECHPCYESKQTSDVEYLQFEARFNAVMAFYLKNDVKDINKYITLRSERDHSEWWTASLVCPIFKVCFYPYLPNKDLSSLGYRVMMDHTETGPVFWFRYSKDALCAIATVFLSHMKDINCRPIHSVAPESSEVKIARRKVNTESSQDFEVEFVWISSINYHEKEVNAKRSVGSICYCNLAFLENKGVHMRKSCSDLNAKKKKKDRQAQLRRHVFIPKGDLRETLLNDRNDPKKRLLYSPGTSKFKLGPFSYEEHLFNGQHMMYRCAYFDLKLSKLWFYSIGGPFNLSEFTDRKEFWYNSREEARVRNVMITEYSLFSFCFMFLTH